LHCVGRRRRCEPFPLGRTNRIGRDATRCALSCLNALRSSLSDRSFHGIARRPHELVFGLGRRQDGRWCGAGHKPERRRKERLLIDERCYPFFHLTSRFRLLPTRLVYGPRHLLLDRRCEVLRTLAHLLDRSRSLNRDQAGDVIDVAATAWERDEQRWITSEVVLALPNAAKVKVEVLE